jgi:hypothetical protein
MNDLNKHKHLKETTSGGDEKVLLAFLIMAEWKRGNNHTIALLCLEIEAQSKTHVAIS